MKILIINSAEPAIREFIEPLVQITEKTGTLFSDLEYRKLLDIDPHTFDGVIISGSPQGDDIIESHQPYFQWLKEYHKPVLGICAGHHIIGHMYGSEIFRSKEIEKGEIEIQIVNNVPIFNGYNNKFKGIAMHNDSISVPEGFTIIASTEKCQNEAMMNNDRPWFTLQFHPEINNEKIIRNFIRLVKNKNEHRGLEAQRR